MRIFGILPAAGKSRRMGRAKLLLPCAGTTVLERVIQAVRAAGVAEIVVVTAPDADELSQVAHATQAHVVRLAQDTPDMRATCEFGLAWIKSNLHPENTDRWLLLPADHPTIRPGAVSALLGAAQACAEKSIFVPTFHGRRGHPTMFGWEHVAGIREFEKDLGLNAYIRQHEGDTKEVEWLSDEILYDLDTPEDYERMLKRCGGGA
jgi:molybdenum cofactor cytidylyltransferase